MYTQVSGILQTLRIADARTVGEILHAKGVYTTLQSSRVNAQKKLNELVSLGQLERGNGFYRTLDCRSEFKDHSRLLTQALAEVLKLPVEPCIFREHVISEVALRADAVCLLTRNGQGLCLIIEVCNNEPEEYFQTKVNVWHNWPDALAHLSNLFKYKIPHFEIVKITDLVGFTTYLKEVL